MDPDTFFDLFLHDSDGPGRRTGAPTPAALRRMWRRVQARSLVRNEPALRVACKQGFVLRTAQLPDVGVTPRKARTRVRSGSWSAPQPKSVAVLDPRSEIESCKVSDRFVIERRRHALAGAAAALLNPGFAVGARSAAILRGWPTIEIPRRPELIAQLHVGSHRRGKAAVRSDELENWYGIPMLAAARTVVDVARHDRREGIVVADAALREGAVDAESLSQALERSRGWCGIQVAREIVALADALAESPLESLTRLAVHDSGFPPPQLQVEFRVPGLHEPYRVDLYWPHRRVILECDGRIKYSKDQRWKEKKREIALERLGNTVERVVWSDVLHDWESTSTHLWTRLG